MKLITSLLLQLISISLIAQIDMNDSTAQVVTYWSIGDHESYSISLQKIKLNGADTTKNETMTYDVDVTVVDSTANSYTVEWFYHNYNTNSTNELVTEILKVSQDLKVLIKVDEFGVVQGVENWEEVRDYMTKALTQISDSFRDIPNVQKVFDQILLSFTTKEAIEATAIKDVIQFHNFHGGKYKLNEELAFTMESPNIYDPQNPFDTEVTISLDELNPDENNMVLRSTQSVNSEQLTNATLLYLQKVAKNLEKEPPTRKDIKPLSNLTTNASRIHGTGWLIYSIATKTVSSDGITSIEERIMEIQ